MPHSTPSPLERRILRLIALVCVGFGCLAIFGQWVIDQRSARIELQGLFASIERSYLPGLTEAAWNFDQDQIKVQLEGLLNLPYMAQASVKFGENQHISLGIPPVEADNTCFPLVHVPGNRAIRIGELCVSADSRALNKKILTRLTAIAAAQILQIAILVWVLWWLIRYFLLRHIHAISLFARQMPRDGIPPLTLERRPSQDEMTSLVNDLNNTYLRLVTARDQDRRYRQRLEQAVEQRTQELAWSNERLELCLEGGQLATWDWNVETNQNSVDERWTAMLGYEPWQYDGSFDQFFRWIHPLDRARVSEVIAAHLQQETAFYECDFRMHHRSGRYLWIHASGRVTSRQVDGQPLRMSGIHQDITHRKESEEALLRVERQLRTFTAIVDSHVLIRRFNSGGELTEVSDAFCRRSGWTCLELIGLPWAAAFNVEHDELPWRQLKNQGHWEGELPYLHRNGDVFWLAVRITPTREDGKTVGYTEIGEDVTARLTLEKLSITDELTGLYNRRHFNRCYDFWREQPGGLLLLLADVDFFKGYNDRYGHQAGDRALQQVARAFQRAAQEHEAAAFRIGGEEFGLLLRTDEMPMGQQLADALRHHLFARHIPHEGSIYQVLTISVGGHWAADGSQFTLEQSYQLADDALYLAKEAGRNCFMWASRKSVVAAK